MTKSTTHTPTPEGSKTVDATSATSSIGLRPTPPPWISFEMGGGGIAIEIDNGPGAARKRIATVGLPLSRESRDSGHDYYSDSTDAANAALIVRAVNHHEALVAALRKTSDMLGAVAGDIEDGGSLDSLRGKYVMALVDLRDDARAVLAQAEGDPK